MYWTRAAAVDLSPSVQQHARPGLHPSLRFGWFAQRSPSVWLYNRSEATLTPPRFDDTSEGNVIVRPASEVIYRRADAAEVALLRHVQAGLALNDAGGGPRSRVYSRSRTRPISCSNTSMRCR